MIRGVRGATTVEKDEESMILSATEELFHTLIKENSIDPSQVASLFISVTPDIRSVFPSKALRNFKDWKYVPIMNMQEIPVENSLQKCIRVMIHLNTDSAQQEIHHVYLNRATVLRPDLTEKE
ncbi:chorismate mutase [Heyndrickxia ginsengihumi]|uniref:chorismate mutase n=1 Tax=Heyndrickxia ginsengihumi TaxID=363870 RepID=A0A0A6Y0E2_9BACI|nr:chorismate mutase [Heyndrickxia ginsengihumi]KHD85772.1 chorismate mutase [Heyndrickxia ginsengihumi]MBE6183486.1 chorismate mutase [Bacillus sp. (in: firmicutes)]MCM3022925.1 chorismate mutase [Heyndrickxia ginsengihumi]NEY20647.1 chorismate mutase [Heyndrickxia ginsengihumi]